MKISKDVRNYAAKVKEQEATGVSAEGAVTPSFVQKGLEEMAKKFRAGGDKIYVPIPPAELDRRQN